MWRLIHHDQVGFIAGMQGMVRHTQIDQHETSHNRMKKYDYLNKCGKSIKNSISTYA